MMWKLLKLKCTSEIVFSMLIAMQQDGDDKNKESGFLVALRRFDLVFCLNSSLGIIYFTVLQILVSYLNLHLKKNALR